MRNKHNQQSYSNSMIWKKKASSTRKSINFFIGKEHWWNLLFYWEIFTSTGAETYSSLILWKLLDFEVSFLL